MNRPIVIGDQRFATRQDAIEAIRALVARWPDGRAIDGTDKIFVSDLLVLHDDIDRKSGCGIARFEVRTNPTFKRNRGFWIIRTDGSETDFSWLKCIDGQTRLKSVRQALRNEVAAQILRHKWHAFGAGPTPCAVTGRMLREDEAHVDHHGIAFVDLADTWIVEQGGPEQVDLRPGHDGDIGRRLADPIQAAGWRGFHLDNAKLRIVDAHVNMSIGRRGDTPPK